MNPNNKLQIYELKTERLLLRQWSQLDLDAFAEMNADAEVMRYYPNPLTEAESNAVATKFMNLIASKGWGFWALEEIQSKQFIGFVGLHEPDIPYEFVPCVEIGWRLKRDKWGFGYASEAATEALKFGFNVLKLKQVLSFTSVLNTKSEAVMQRIGMHNTGRNFAHPLIPTNHPLNAHILYSIDTTDFSLRYGIS